MTIDTNMGNVAVINLINKNKYSDFNFFKEESVLDRVLSFSEKLPEIEKTLLLLSADEEVDKKSSKIVKSSWTEEDLFGVFSGLSKDFENIFYFWGDYPLLDGDLARKMYGNHVKYYAGYTFADGYPLGLSPEILRSTEIEQLYQLSRGRAGKISRTTVFDVLQKDINAFDIETEISPVDLRMYRISLSCDNRRNSEQLKNLIDAGITDTESLLNKIGECSHLLRTKPSYYQIQITDSCPQLCSYCPFSSEAVPANQKQSMSLENYRELLDRISEFSDDAYISLSAWGEPSMHSGFLSIAEETLKRESLSLIIETSGLGWSNEQLETIKELSVRYNNPVQWIVSLDALDRDLYRQLRGEGYDEAYERADRLIALFGDNCWIQSVRMKENEANLEKFFRFWKKKTENIIIQKYDWFCGEYDQKKITDLSPLNRDPCWHIKRDMFIKLNGDVPLCREDLKCEMKLGNIFKNGLEEIWAAGDSTYRKHIEGDYPLLCRECDEYYTFNF